MYKKTLSLLLCVLFSIGVLSAGGKKETEEKTVTEKESWQEIFDITGKKPGKYNIVVTATDVGGNVSLAGPYNIFIDPNSDLPITGITNPLQDMCVPGNLNIVGTCVDDDAVDRVEIIIDGKTDSPVVAEGKEFWSYYLDTTELLEGSHTLEIYGIDVNGVKGNVRSVLWHLDRRQPQTVVTNQGMGTLVSGRIRLNGTISDGNGIKSLFYSLDGGTSFTSIRIKEGTENSGAWLFELPIDTLKMKDGPAVVWFRATDQQGTAGYYSFLCFVDNTNPEVKIISPKIGEAVNGRFSAAGYARDVIGLQTLSWKFLDKQGEFELIPGNPFWSVNFDTRGQQPKNAELVITARDTAGNVTAARSKITIDQESDRALVTVTSPKNDEVYYGSVDLHGIVKDDDGTAEVKFSLNGETARSLQTDGVFRYPLLEDKKAPIPEGRHSLRVWAVDVDGIEGVPAEISFYTPGPEPAINVENVQTDKKAGETIMPYFDGIILHPEAGNVIKTSITSQCGIKTVSWKYRESEPVSLEIKNPVKGSLPVSIPVNTDRWGYGEIVLSAEDVFGRKTEKVITYYLENLTRTHGSPDVVFSDSDVSEDGLIVLDVLRRVTGYYIGGEAVSAKLVPETAFASVQMEKNSITIVPGKGSGTSEVVRVEVTTKKGTVYQSRPLRFRIPAEPPVVTIENPLLRSGLTEVEVKGTVTSVRPLVSLSARILHSSAVGEWQTLETAPDGSYAVIFGAPAFAPGVSVIEIKAADDENGTGCASVFVRAVAPPPPPPEGKKAPPPAKPVISWIQGENLYYTVAYSEMLRLDSVSVGSASTAEGVSPEGGIIQSSLLKPGDNEIIVKVLDIKDKIHTSKYKYSKPGSIALRLDSVNGSAYYSGMEVYLPETPDPAQKDKRDILVAVSESDFPVNSFSYAFDDGSFIKAPVRRIGETNRYEADIILQNLAPRVTKISVKAEGSKGLNASVIGTISVIRQKDAGLIDDKEQLYWMPLPDPQKTFYSLGKDDVITGFANFRSPLTVSFAKETPGLSVLVNGSSVTLKAEKPGDYADVTLIIKDAEGLTYTSSPVSIRADFEPPAISWKTPDDNIWIQKTVEITGSVQEDTKIVRSDYSVDGGASWRTLTLDAQNRFKQKIDISMCEDGLILAEILIVDSFGRRSSAHRVFYKDTQPPQVTVILPEAGSTINGETRMVMSIRDNGKFTVGEYMRTDGGAGLPGTFESRAAARAEAERAEKDALDALMNPPAAVPPVSAENFTDGSPSAALASEVPASVSDGSAASSAVPSDSSSVPDDSAQPQPVPPPSAPSSAQQPASVPASSAAPKTGAVRYEKETGPGRFGLFLDPLVSTLVGTKEKPLSDDMIFMFTDAAGNRAVLNGWDFAIDAKSDLPVTEIHVPSENEIIQKDFVISGIVYDDDGQVKIWYKIDNGEYKALDGLNTSFAIAMPLASLTDNDHTVTMYSEDIHGVKGEEVSRKFRISLEEPKGEVLTPTIDQTVSERVRITGKASDKNGIERVQLSLDNGNTYNDVAGTEEWEYWFDSHIIQGGTHVVFLKVWDKYGVYGLYSSLINIDNSAPKIRLELPLDDSKSNGTIFFSGETSDNIGLEKLYVTIRNLGLRQPEIPANIAHVDLEPARIIAKTLDASVLVDGFYNIEVTGEDAGGNITRVSRNIEINRKKDTTKIDILYPMNGEHLQGMFNLYGRVISDKPLGTLFLYVDDVESGMAEVTDTGYFKFTLTPEVLAGGSHKVVVRGMVDGKKLISSIEQYLIYTPNGPWVTIDNFTMGDFAIDRPYLEGNSGYAFTESELLRLRSKETSKDDRNILLEKSIEKIEVSFDNGKSFSQVSSAKKWRYRVENNDMPEGFHFFLVRATMKNGETAVTRSIIQIDKTAPFISLISPGEGGRFNENIDFQGLTSDDVALKDVVLSLRSGDKASYEVPSFIQGLYFDWHFWGATLYDIGLGLTFFDDNVKLQFQFGQMTQQHWEYLLDLYGKDYEEMRYGGNVVGAKLLANIGYLPFRYFFGPNWEWLSATFAVGANFSQFSETQSGKPQILSAVLGQLEFPRITIPKQKMFRTYSFYTEVQLWFIPTDVDSGNVDIDSIVPQISGGVRVNLF